MITICAMLLDALLGEPKWLWGRVPHPAVFIGRSITWATDRLNTGSHRFIKGCCVTAGLCLAAGIIGMIFAAFGPIVEILVGAILIAQKSLADHVAAVARDLRYGLKAGRRRMAMIVGRDTKTMAPSDVSRAAIESAAENLSDGVVAPVFWFAIAGLPGILIYKAINTADSMIGYRTERFEQFGKSAAILDDILNYVPARITALMILLAHGTWAPWRSIRADATKHRSPNAGWPEAAMARCLNIALSGPRSYDGVMQDLPWVNEQGRKILGPSDIDAAVWALWRTWGVTLGLIFAFWMVFG